MDNLLDPSLYTASGSGSGSGSDRYPDPISASLDTKTHLLAEDMAMMQNDIQGPNSAYDHVARQQHEGDMGPALNGAYTPADEGKVVLEAKSGGKKKAGGEKEGEKVKRTRQSQSCDACRSRKVKCDRPVPTESTPDPNSDAKCTHCRTLDMPCTFDYKPKKRGPPNRYLEKLQAEAQSGSPSRSPAQHGSTGRGGSSKGQGPITAASLQSALHAKDMADAWGSAQVYGQDRPVSRGYEAGPEMGWLGSIGGAGNEGVGGAGYAQPGSAVGSSFAHPAWTPPERPHSHSHSQTQSHHNPLLSPSHTLASATASAAALPLSFPTDPLHSLRHPPSNPLDALLPRSLLNQIIALYFDYVYALIPIIHRPTFMHDLSHNREERPGQEEWTCMTLALVASTLVQVPRSFVALPRREVRMLAETCYVRARAYLGLSVDGRASVQLCTSLYLLTFTANLLHRPAEGALMFGALAGMHLRGHWTDPSTYSTLSPLEAQLRRRIYWLAYGGDRSWAAIEGTSCIYPEEDVGGMPYPLEIDDEFISETGVSDQPAGTTSLISGFVCISRLYKICGHVMDRRRRDKKSPPQGLLLQMRLNEVDDLYDQAMGVMDGCAEPLRLDLESDTRSNDGFSEDWDAHASAGIRSLFLDPKASKAVVKDAYLVQQANIYVAQQMVRYMVILYREDLYELQRLELARQSGSASADSHGPIGKLRRKSSTRRDWSHNVAAGEEKEQVATDLLAILQKIPIQVIAINSVSVVTKVRFVASSLLDALANPAEVPDDPSPAQVRAANKTQRAQTYLWDFLRILSEIEALYSLDDTGST